MQQTNESSLRQDSVAAEHRIEPHSHPRQSEVPTFGISKDGSGLLSTPRTSYMNSIPGKSYGQQYPSTIGYQYSKLRAERKEIRILELQRGHSIQFEKAVLDLKFTTISLNDADDVPYSAVSYAWDKDAGFADIVLGGVSTKIPATAEQALRRIFANHRKLKLGKPPLIWIDAVCINQQDLSEKSSQVSIMGNIYARATKVLIWPGNDDDRNATAAFKGIRKLARDAQRWTSGTDEIIRNNGLWAKSWLPYYDRKLPKGDWSALQEMINMKWFRRLWVLQEVALAREAHFLLGNKCGSWETLSCALSWWFHRIDSTPSPVKNDFELATTLRSAVNIARRRNRLQKHGLDDMDQFDSLLEDSFVLGTSDPCDKIYALLGLISTNIQPDYEKPLEAVYAEATLLAMKHSTKPFYLLRAWFSFELKDDGDNRAWPSWIPRFDVPLSCMRSPAARLPTAVATSESASFCLHPAMPFALQVKGVRLGEVQGVHEAPCKPADTTVDLECVRYDLYRHFLYLHGILDLRESDHWSTSVQRLASCLVGGVYDVLRINGGGEVVGVLMSDFWTFTRAILKASSNSTMRNSLEKAVEGAAEDIEEGNEEDTEEDIEGVTWAKGDTHGVVGAEEDSIDSSTVTGSKFSRAAAYLKEMEWQALHFPFIEITGQQYGLGPTNVMQGDEICLLFGADEPFVLRKHGDYWRLRGPCYVEGIMMGEYLIQLMSERRLKSEIETFTIV